MPPSIADIERILSQAAQIADPSARRLFIDGACADDRELRREVDRLLALYFEAGTFLEHSPDFQLAAILGGLPESAVEELGTTIGPYKLREVLGEGGMGIVYVAEQEHPIRRKVALKVIKPGMDTREVIARFEAERQALALMDHPNIAKVLDAGTRGERKDSGFRGRQVSPP